MLADNRLRQSSAAGQYKGCQEKTLIHRASKIGRTLPRLGQVVVLAHAFEIAQPATTQPATEIKMFPAAKAHPL